MTEKQEKYFNGIVLNEGAYFYKYIDPLKYNERKRNINEAFKNIKDNTDNYVKIVKVLREPIDFDVDKKALCSLLIFTAKAVPPFLSAIEAGYQLLETIVGYALIIEIDEYVVIMSRHASGMNSFKKSMIPINGSKLTGSLLSSDSKFTQLRIGNMSLNPNALRNRSYEGNDLNMSLPTFGLNQNQVKSTRLQTTSDESIIVNLSTSRVSKFGEKKKIKELCLWSDKIIGGIKSPFDIDKTFLNNFARPLRWQEKSKKLTPTYILIDIHELRNIISKHEVELVYGKKK